MRRFDPEGRFLNVVAKRGDGPGDFRNIPGAVVVEAAGIRYWDRGRIQWVAADGIALRSQLVDISRWMAIPTMPTLLHVFGNGELALRWGERMPLFPSSVSRSSHLLHYARATVGGELLESLYSYRSPGGIVMDGGRTFIGYPGPADAPIVLYEPPFVARLRLPAN